MKKRTYVLTKSEAERYDSDDDKIIDQLMRELRKRFGRIAAGEAIETEVHHPDGFVVSAHTQRDENPRPTKGTAEYVNRRSEKPPRRSPTKRVKKRRRANRRFGVFPNPSGFALFAKRGVGPKMHFTGEKFSNNGKPKVFPSIALAKYQGEHLMLKYPILKKYRVTVETILGK